MNKKVALVTLIEASMVASTEEKLALIDLIPEMTEAQVDAWGKYFAKEREMVLAGEQDVMAELSKLFSEESADSENAVYVGSGKATQ